MKYYHFCQKPNLFGHAEYRKIIRYKNSGCWQAGSGWQEISAELWCSKVPPLVGTKGKSSDFYRLNNKKAELISQKNYIIANRDAIDQLVLEKKNKDEEGEDT